MAADRATISVSASLLPDEIKTSVGGTIIYDIDDLGDNNKWTYSLTIVGASSNVDALLASVPFLGQGTSEEGATATVNGTDDVVFFFIKHSGTTDGATSTTANLHINLSAGTATGSAVGDIVIKPNECFFARLGNTEIDDINADSSSGNIQAQVFAICDDGGV